MANLFGAGQPVIYVDGATAYTLPRLPQNGREEDFKPEIISSRTGFDGKKTINKKYRMHVRYTWVKIDPTDLDNLVQTLNRPGQKELKFPAFSRRYAFNVIDHKRVNAGGSELYDGFYLELEGADLVSHYPSLDSLNFIFRRWNSAALTH